MPRAVRRAADAVRGAPRVLELAAGTGLFTRDLASAAREVVATDYAPQMVERLRERVKDLSNVQVEQADLYALRFPPGSFDAVVAANVLHLVPDLEAALAAMGAMLKPNGRLIVPTYCHEQTRLSTILSRIATRIGFPAHRRFRQDTLVAAIERAGFEVVDSEVIAGLFPIVFVEALRRG